MSSENPFGDADVNPYSPSSEVNVTSEGVIQLPDGQLRGMVGQIPVLGILMVVQGVFDCFLGALLGFYALLIPQFLNDPNIQGADMPEAMTTILPIALGVGGGVVVLIGILTIFGGIGLFRFRGRVFGIVVLCVGILKICTVYCFPTSLALAIYGLIVLLNQPVKMAFDLGKQGHTGRRIQQAFAMLP